MNSTNPPPAMTERDNIKKQKRGFLENFDYYRRNWMFRIFWDFGNWLDGGVKWKFGVFWIEISHLGVAIKHFAWAVYDFNNWNFKKAFQKLGWSIGGIVGVMRHAASRLIRNKTKL
jgi:hypothetical protein